MTNSKFDLKSVALLKSSFERPLHLHFTADEVVPAIAVKVGFGQPPEPIGRVEVELAVSVSVPTGAETSPMRASATVVGFFDLVGDVPADAIAYFGNINGPAILYPFVREVIASLTMRGNVPPVLLPTVNFQAAYESSQHQKLADQAASPVPTPKKRAAPKKHGSQPTNKKAT